MSSATLNPTNEFVQLSHETHYRVHVALCRYQEGGFTAIVPELPGAISEGDTEEEAIHNIAEAFRAVVQAHAEEFGEVKWDRSRDHHWRIEMAEDGVIEIKDKWLAINA